ncbi:MAG: helix-turn-helix domain-containing protein [SAR202 cluster bacterium]|nr:helix-turn-helix domain-containing protein [SAR202 cluster bacterium]
MDSSVEGIVDRKWVTLGMARALLGINEATLRQWADRGMVRAFRTPGGHRRFSLEDINALMTNGHRADGAIDDATVLPRVRRKVHRAHHAMPAWLEHLDPEVSGRLREIGGQLLHLCVTQGHDDSRQKSLTLARKLGQAYGQALASSEVPLEHAVQAFVFFRETTMSAVAPSLAANVARAQQASQYWRQISRLTDAVLLGMTAAYQRARVDDHQ